MGLKRGEHPEKLSVIRIVSARQEPLFQMEAVPMYGESEVIREGFPEMTPREFIDMFCEHNGCKPWTTITRLEFEYV